MLTPLELCWLETPGVLRSKKTNIRFHHSLHIVIHLPSSCNHSSIGPNKNCHHLLRTGNLQLSSCSHSQGQDLVMGLVLSRGIGMHQLHNPGTARHQGSAVQDSHVDRNKCHHCRAANHQGLVWELEWVKEMAADPNIFVARVLEPQILKCANWRW